ncbi:MAG: hypothetical protein LBP90_06535 [Burkholderiales bacterium]|jgi:hypothetical protein|nr:hypothetical protein [Burkholderiales bacterium]
MEIAAMKRKILMLMALCASLTGCATTERVAGEYALQLSNMEEADIFAWIQLDNKKHWGGSRVVLVGKRGRSYGALAVFSGNPMPWPKRLTVRWELEGIKGMREQEMDLSLYPLKLDGTPSDKPYLYFVFFEDRVLAFGLDGWISREIEDKAKIEYEAARAAGVPGARIVASQEEEKKLVSEERRPQPNAKTDVDSEKNLPPFPTCKDVDDCVRLAVLENSVFVEACGTVAPEIKKEMQNAFANWVVLKLPIPGLQQTLSPDNPDRANLLAHILPYLKKIPSHEMSIECGGRYAMMKNPEPTILSDAASLPKDVLKRYQR